MPAKISGMTESEMILADLYDQQPLPLDRLPYTIEFEKIFHDMVSKYPVTRALIWNTLMKMRKDGTLQPKKKERKEKIERGDFR